MNLKDVQPTVEELRVILETGYVLRNEGKLDDAETVFRGLMELLPDSDLPRVALSTVELTRGRLAEALAACEEALQLRPDSSYARVSHAKVLLFQHRREEAEAELRQVIAADSDSPHSRIARSLLDAADSICAQVEQSGSGFTMQPRSQGGSA